MGDCRPSIAALTICDMCGTFRSCLKAKETVGIEKGTVGYKYYAPGIGLIKDVYFELTDHTRQVSPL